MTVVMDAGTLREDTLDLVKGVDIVIASEGFGRSLVGPDGSYEEILERLRALGCRQAVVTLGVKGSIGLDHDGVIRQPAFSVASKDTTGAGDVYHGGYIYGLLQGWEMGRCMAFASAAAALKCRNGGGWRGIPQRPEIEEIMRMPATHISA
jgi:sulfofructose kinase